MDRWGVRLCGPMYSIFHECDLAPPAIVYKGSGVEYPFVVFHKGE